MAEKKILKELYADLIKGLDPESAATFLSKGLLTDYEKEKVDAATTRSKKNTALVDALRRREAVKALTAIIEVLEGEDETDKEANSELLKKIAAKYPAYSFETGLQGQLSTDNPAPQPVAPVAVVQPVHVQVPSLPKFEPTQMKSRGPHTDTGSDPTLTSPSVQSSHNEGTDGGRTDRYKVNSVPRGYCIIINNVTFATLKARAGSHWDANALQELFGGYLGFHVERYEDLDTKRIMHLMNTVQQQNHSQLSCLVVAILTHGINGEIYGTDGKLIKIETLTECFSGRWCPSLVGKPKIFLLQACRGGTFDYGAIEATDDGGIDESAVLDQDETDGGGYTLLPDNADFVLAYATTPGYVSWRNSAFGTWFVKAFVDTMYDRADSDHLMDILVEVNRKVAEEYESRGKQKQMPAPVTTLRYKLYLPPVQK